MFIGASLMNRRKKVCTRCVLLSLVIVTFLFSLGIDKQGVHASSYPLSREELRQLFLSVAEQEDVATLGFGLTNYIEALFNAQSELPWGSSIPKELFTDYVIPVRFNPSYRIETAYYYPERVEDWRSQLYSLAKQIIKGENKADKVASLLHRWVHDNIPYLAVNQPQYLQPSLILEKKGGSCWHNAVLLAASYRSVMLPARIVVGAHRSTGEAIVTGKAVSGRDLELVVMEAFWISRDWKIWEKEFRVYDETAGTYLKSDDYSTAITTIDAAGKERLALRISALKAFDHTFTVRFRYTMPQGHEWVEIWIPTRGWVAVDGTASDGYDYAARMSTGFFDIQAYNPRGRAWVSSYFFYKPRSPLRMLLMTARSIVSEARPKGVDCTLAEKRIDEANRLYTDSLTKELSNEEKQKTGERVFQLCGQAIVMCLSGDVNAAFDNIWDAAVQAPQTIAKRLFSNATRLWGTILPYGVFDFSTAKRLYVDAEPPRRDPPYCNEVKREYFWLDSLRSSLSSNTRMSVMMLGYDQKSRSWKCTITTVDSFTLLEGASIEKEFSELSFMTQKPDGSADDWLKQTPIITDPEGDSKNNSLDCDLKAVYALADRNYLYVMIQVWGKHDPGNNYVFPVDLDGDDDWDYSFGFTRNSVWMYDLRSIPNGQWPVERLSTLDVSFEIDKVAEIAIPLDIMASPTRIRMMLWIYYPSQRITTDETSWGTVPFTSTPLTTTKSVATSATTTASQPTVLTTQTAPTTTGQITAYAVFIGAAAAVVALAVYLKRKK